MPDLRYRRRFQPSTGFQVSKISFSRSHHLPARHSAGILSVLNYRAASATTITADRVEWWDLWLDYWIGLNRPGILLDEDEVPSKLDAKIQWKLDQAKRRLLAEADQVAADTMLRDWAQNEPGQTEAQNAET